MALGILIGSMVRTVMHHVAVLDVSTIAILVIIMVGAASIGTIFKHANASENPDGVYFYPVGLLVGYVATALIHMLVHK